MVGQNDLKPWNSLGEDPCRVLNRRNGVADIFEGLNFEDLQSKFEMLTSDNSSEESLSDMDISSRETKPTTKQHERDTSDEETKNEDGGVVSRDVEVCQRLVSRRSGLPDIFTGISPAERDSIKCLTCVVRNATNTNINQKNSTINKSKTKGGDFSHEQTSSRRCEIEDIIPSCTRTNHRRNALMDIFQSVSQEERNQLLVSFTGFTCVVRSDDQDPEVSSQKNEKNGSQEQQSDLVGLHDRRTRKSGQLQNINLTKNRNCKFTIRTRAQKFREAFQRSNSLPNYGAFLCQALETYHLGRRNGITNLNDGISSHDDAQDLQQKYIDNRFLVSSI